LAWLLPVAHPLLAEALAVETLTPTVVAFRYLSDDSFAVAPIPARGEIVGWLERPTAFRAAVAKHIGQG